MEIIRKDMLLRSAFAGAVAALLAAVSLYLMNLFIPGPTINMPELTMEVFVDPEYYSTLLGRAMGMTWSLIVGGLYALFYMIALHFTGWNNLWWKAIIVVSGIWVVVGSLDCKLMDLSAAQQVRSEPLSVFAFFVAHLLFATYLSFIVSRLAPEDRSPA